MVGIKLFQAGGFDAPGFVHSRRVPERAGTVRTPGGQFPAQVFVLRPARMPLVGLAVHEAAQTGVSDLFRGLRGGLSLLFRTTVRVFHGGATNVPPPTFADK